MERASRRMDGAIMASYAMCSQTVILDGKFSIYSYIPLEKWKVRIFDILPVAQLYKNVMYIEIICKKPRL
jgi:hypothetical protein